MGAYYSRRIILHRDLSFIAKIKMMCNAFARRKKLTPNQEIEKQISLRDVMSDKFMMSFVRLFSGSHI